MNIQPFTPNTEGIFRIEAESYHKAPGVSKHTLDAMFDSPEQYQFLKRHGLKSTEAMEMSTLCHTAVLEPENLKDGFYLRPDKFKTGEKQAWLATHPDKLSITRDELTTIQNIAASCRNHPIAGVLLEDGEAELSLFAKCPITGMLRKGRPDWITSDGDDRTTLVDLKFVADCSKHAFRKQVENLRYFVQHAYYVDLCELLGFDKPRFLFVAVEKTPMHPEESKHKVRVIELHDLDVEFGRNMYIRDLKRLEECIKSGIWPDDTDTIELLTLSPWYRKGNAV